MAEYRLSDRYKKFAAKEYSLYNLVEYYERHEDYCENEHLVHDLRIISEKCKNLFSAYGYTEPELHDEIRISVHKKFFGESADLNHRGKINQRTMGKERLFSFLQVVAYMYEKPHNEDVFYYLRHPSCDENAISVYKMILEDLAANVPEKYPLSEVENASNNIRLTQDYIGIITNSLSTEYGSSISAVEELQKRVKHFRAVTQTEKTWHTIHYEHPNETTYYVDALYRIAAFCKCCIWEAELLRAFQNMKKSVLAANQVAEEFAKMIQPQYKKIEPTDQVSLVFSDGKIVEATAEHQALIEATASMDHKEYLDALELYIHEHISELARKVFCTDAPTKNQKRLIKSHIEDVRNYWDLEYDRYNNHGFLSKVKLISIFQASYLSLPRSGYTMKKSGTPKTRDGFRETPSISSSRKNLHIKNPFYLLVFCVWVDYQTIFNTASPEYAGHYLDVSIAALDAILHKGGKFSISQTKKSAERVLCHAVKSLIYDGDDQTEILSLILGLSNALQAPVLCSATFFEPARFHRFGGFCRLYSVTDIVSEILREMNSWDRKKALMVNIDKAGGFIDKTSPLFLHISHDPKQNTYILDNVSADR